MGVEQLGAAEAALLEHYLDTVEHLPDDVQRTISQLREIDQQYQHVLGELERMMCQSDPKKALIQKSLVRAQELADEKLHHMQQLMDTIDNKSRQLDFDARTLDKLNRHHSPATNFSDCISKDRLLDRNQNSPAGHSSDDNSNQNIPNNSNNHSCSSNNGTANSTHNNIHGLNSAADRISQQIGKHKEENSQSSSAGNAGAKRARRNATTPKDYSESSYEKREKRGSAQQNAKGNKRGNSEGGQSKKRKSGRQQEVISPVEAIDPDEPTYCLCQQVSFGEMICCDNEECSIEWFHFACVSLNTKPKGKWFCPRCRGDRSNQMKKVS